MSRTPFASNEMTATPQQLHALVQIVRNVFHKQIPVSEEEERRKINI